MAGQDNFAAIKRRGLIAGAAALVAGIAAKQGSQPVGATHQPEDLWVGNTNTTAAATATRLSYSGTGLQSPAILIVEDNGLEPGLSHQAAVAGYALSNPGNVDVGVHGVTISYSADNAGVLGQHLFNGTGVRGLAGTNGTAVYGECYGSVASHGVWGNTDQGKGVFGQATDSRGTGVSGVSGGTGAGNGNGVYGYVYHVGTSQVTAGVFGDSAYSYGVIGRTSAVNYSGCTGIADGAGRAAFAGAGTNGAYGAYFTGPTVVAGDFTVVGGQKNAAVKHADGSYRLLHCVESPEPWFEDFGEAKLVNGKAEVKLDADFAAVVDASAYHVFLTPGAANNKGLAATGKRAGGFTVQELHGGASSGMFSYRIVAKRKDIKVGRLAKFELPKIILPKPEEMPPPPQPPKKP
ncbi:MAG: hypothetical protein ACYDAR_10135 [Thermomicrobiales bacterium]